MIPLLGSFICRFRGHRWRRLRKGERTYIPADGLGMLSPDNYRACDRCGITRKVKRRARLKVVDELTEANRTRSE